MSICAALKAHPMNVKCIQLIIPAPPAIEEGESGCGAGRSAVSGNQPAAVAKLMLCTLARVVGQEGRQGEQLKLES